MNVMVNDYLTKFTVVNNFQLGTHETIKDGMAEQQKLVIINATHM